MSWNKMRSVSYTQKAYFSQICLQPKWTVVKIIHPPDRCGIWRSWLNSAIITRMDLVLGTIKGHSKMCSFITQRHRYLQVLREGAIGMQTAGISTRAVAREFHVNFSTNFVLENLAVHRPGLTPADHVYGIVWESSLLMSTLGTECPWWR